MDTEATHTPALVGRVRPLAIALALAVLVYLFPLPGVTEEGRRLAAVLAIVGTLWMTEAIPLSVTALLGPSLAVVLGVAPAERAFGAFANPIIMLFVGSFLLARAAFKYRLTERIAYRVLSLNVLRNDPTRAFVFLGLTTAAISAWVSNTATTAMMLPIAQAVLLAVIPADGRAAPPTYAAGLMLVVTYSASIGGLFTPIGSPTNLIGLGLIEQATGVRVSFLDWVVQVFPISFLILLFMMGYLAYVFRGDRTLLRYDRRQMLERYTALGPWTAVEKRVTVALLITVSLWLFPPLIALLWSSAGALLTARFPEAVVPLLVAATLFWIPVDGNGDVPILEIRDLARIDWPVIVLFAGGMCLGELIIDTGLAHALGESLAAYVPPGQSPLLGLVFSLLAIGVSETTSNAASANIVVPIVTAVSAQVGGDTLHLALLATVACSFGFMLPVSTPTNAMAYATGHVSQRQMVRYGVVLDIAGAILLSLWFGVVL